MNENHNEDAVERALWDKSITRFHGYDGQSEQIIETNRYVFSKQIPKIERFVKELAQSSEVLFVKETDAKNPQKISLVPGAAGKIFLDLLTIDLEDIQACFANNKLNSYFEVFRKHTHFHLKDGAPFHQRLYGEQLLKRAEALNACIESIRQTVRTQEFSTAIKTRQRAANKNHKALLDYIDALFACHSRILVLRIDFSYKTLAVCGVDFHTTVDFPEIKEHHNLLIKHLKSKMCKDSYLGFATKFEYGLEKGYHTHSLIFLNGSRVREDVVIAKMIGDYWSNTLTKGRGMYYNCNVHKEKYEHLGVGMINYSDAALIANLKEYVAPYLNKTDYFIKLITPEKSRAFIKGNMIKTKPRKRGRPRSKMQDMLETTSPLSLPR